MNLNLEIIEICGDSVIKINNAIFQSKRETRDVEIVQYNVNNEYPNLFNQIKEDEFEYYSGNILLVEVLKQYFHNIIDVFPKILKLLDANENFKVIFYTQDKLPSYRIIEQNKYIFELIDQLNIPYEFSKPETRYFKLEYGYVFMQKQSFHWHTNRYNNNDQFDPMHWLFSKFFIHQTSWKCKKHFGAIIDLYRKYFYNKDIIPNKKIFISRKDAYRRALDDSDVLENFFSSKGFEIICLQEMPILEQINYFNNATHIAALAGSSLTNIIFSNPKVQVLEILSHEDFDPPEFVEFARWLDIDMKSVDFFGNATEIVKQIQLSESSFIKRMIEQ